MAEIVSGNNSTFLFSINGANKIFFVPDLKIKFTSNILIDLHNLSFYERRKKIQSLSTELKEKKKYFELGIEPGTLGMDAYRGFGYQSFMEVMMGLC